jgi:hypothetical protein
MAAQDKGSKSSKPLNSKLLALIVVSIAAVVGVVLVVATLFRSGGFSVVAQGQGNSIEFKFSESRVDLNQVLDKLLAKQKDGDADTASRQRIVSSILQAHGYYYVPSEEVISYLRRMKETDDTRQFIQAVRGLLFDLAGPFSRPATFLNAPDARVLLALDDVYKRNPANPLIAALWEMSLDLKGIFSLRQVNVAVREDKSLKEGTAATCAGSLLLDKVAIVNSSGERLIGVRVAEPKPCEPTSAENMLAGKETALWVSAADMSNLIGAAPALAAGKIQAKLVPIPKRLAAGVLGP